MNSTTESGTKLEFLSLRLSAGKSFPCAELFGRGVRVRAETGVSIKDLLCRQLGVAESYLDERIQTVFLNGRAVDDVSNSRVEGGDALSLSAAMPGLVGATFRRGGHLAAFRQNISYVAPDDEDTLRTGPVTIKLFNMVARELGPHLLKIGVILAGRDLAGPLKAAGKDLNALERNGAPVPLEQLSDLLDSDRDVWLRVETSSE